MSRGASSSIVPIIGDVPRTRSPEQQRFELALRRQKVRLAAVRHAVQPWGGPSTVEIVEATVLRCGRYYDEACVLQVAERRSRATVKAEIAKAADLADRLSNALRSVWTSRDPAVHDWLEPVVATRLGSGDGIPTHPLDPALLRSIHELWRRLALLDQALPNDAGGPRPAVAFSDLVRALARIYCDAAGTEIAPISTKDRFFRYVGAVTDLLRSVSVQFPTAKFDLPRGDDEALRKLLVRLSSGRTQPGP